MGKLARAVGVAVGQLARTLVATISIIFFHVSFVFSVAPFSPRSAPIKKKYLVNVVKGNMHHKYDLI